MEVVDELRRAWLELPQRGPQCIGRSPDEASGADPIAPIGNSLPDIDSVVGQGPRVALNSARPKGTFLNSLSWWVGGGVWVEAQTRAGGG